jgi:2-phosphosulfolactate phosphatase
MIIDAYLTPYFNDNEKQFENSIIIMIDVLRSSSTICAALFNGAKEIIPTDTLDKAVSIYSSLSKENRFLGGERNGLKPSGFNAGNSPEEYSADVISGKSVIISTTNGTKIFSKARQAKARLVGSFVNNGAILGHLFKQYLNDSDKSEEDNTRIIFICAGSNGRLAYEDTLCAGAFINSIVNLRPDVRLTDSADVAKNLFKLHSTDLKEFLKNREHASLLKEIGLENDIETCFTFDLYPVIPHISGGSIKIFDEKELQ